MRKTFGTVQVLTGNQLPGSNRRGPANFKGQLYLENSSGHYYRSREAGDNVLWDRVLVATKDELVAELSDEFSSGGGSGESPVIFDAGTNAAAIRPVTTAPVIWLCTVEPDHWIDGDTWLNTTQSVGDSGPSMPSGLVSLWSVKDLAALTEGATVSSWADRVGALALTPASGTPTFNKAGDFVSYDGVDDVHNATMSLVQPSTFLIVARLPVATASQPILGSNTAIHSLSTNSSSVPQLNAGTALSGSGALTANQWFMLTGIANGANSGISVNAGTRSTGNAGANARSSLKVASNTGGTSFARLDVKAIAVFNRVLTDVELGDVKTILNTQLGLSL